MPRPSRSVSLPGGRLGGFLTDVDGFLNLWAFDPDFNAKPLVAEPFEHGDPGWGPGQRSFAWSPDGDRIAFNRNEGGFGRLCVADVATGAVEEVAKGVHGSLTWEGDRLAALRSGARTPTEIVVYDAKWQRVRVVAARSVASSQRVLSSPSSSSGPATTAAPSTVVCTARRRRPPVLIRRR